MEKNRKLQVVEYREGDRVVRLLLRRRQDPPPTMPAEISELRCELVKPGVYRVIFTADGRTRSHEYPLHEVARCEGEWPPREEG